MGKVVFLLVVLIHVVTSQNVVLVPETNPVLEGRDFVFLCNDTQNSNFNLVYTVDGTNSGATFGRLDPTPDSGDEILFTFPNVTRNDNGTRFTCRILGSVQSATLIVRAVASFTKASINEALFCNTPLDVTFGYMEGFPEGSISVTKDGQSFTSNSSRINASGIWIPSLTVADAGTYVVTSTNEAGAASATLSLTVYCGPNLVVGNNASRTITLNEGDSFTANCAVASSVPPARIYFIVGTNTPMDITSNPVQTINDVKPNNAGTYVCRAESGQANTTYTYTLEIRSVQPSTTTASPPTTTSSPVGSPGASPASGAGIIKFSVLIGVFLLISSFLLM